MRTIELEAKATNFKQSHIKLDVEQPDQNHSLVTIESAAGSAACWPLISTCNGFAKSALIDGLKTIEAILGQDTNLARQRDPKGQKAAELGSLKRVSLGLSTPARVVTSRLTPTPIAPLKAAANQPLTPYIQPHIPTQPQVKTPGESVLAQEQAKMVDQIVEECMSQIEGQLRRRVKQLMLQKEKPQ